MSIWGHEPDSWLRPWSGSAGHDAILETLRSQGIEPTVIHAPGSFAGVAQLVAGGAGWAAVLDVVRESVPPGTVARPVQGLDAMLELHVLRRADDESTAAILFEQLVAEACSATPAQQGSAERRGESKP